MRVVGDPPWAIPAKPLGVDWLQVQRKQGFLDGGGRTSNAKRLNLGGWKTTMWVVRERGDGYYQWRLGGRPRRVNIIK